MTRIYEIGNFTIEVKSNVHFQDAEPYSLFLSDEKFADYSISVDFTSDLPHKIENPQYISNDRECVYIDDVLHCYYKSRDTGEGYYGCRIKDGKNITILIDKKYRDSLWTRVIFSLAGIEEIVAENNGCVLHSSFIEKDGNAILFTGPCSIGKSTQAQLWKKYADADIINGDKTLIFEKDGTVFASGMPFSGSSKDCINRVVPIKAIICLQQSESNKSQFCAKDESFYKLYKNCYPVPYSRECTDKLIDFIEKVSQNVSVYDYACLPDESAVRFLERELCLI